MRKNFENRRTPACLSIAIILASVIIFQGASLFAQTPSPTPTPQFFYADITATNGNIPSNGTNPATPVRNIWYLLYSGYYPLNPGDTIFVYSGGSMAYNDTPDINGFKEIFPFVMDPTITNDPLISTPVSFVGVTDFTETLFTADGTNIRYIKYIKRLPVKAGSVVVTNGAVTVTDTGTGALTGCKKGTIDYTTGKVDILFNSIPPAGSIFNVTYTCAVKPSIQCNYKPCDIFTYKNVEGLNLRIENISLENAGKNALTLINVNNTPASATFWTSVINCDFLGNVEGSVSSDRSNILVTGTNIIMTQSGPGIYSSKSRLQVYNSTIHENYYTIGGGILALYNTKDIQQDDSFDSYDLGSLPSSWERYGYAVTDTSLNAITNTIRYSYPNSLQVSGLTTADNPAFFMFPTNFSSLSGKVVLEGRIRASNDIESATSTSNYTAALGFATSSSGESTEAVARITAGSIKGDNVADFVSGGTSVPVNYNVWMRVRIEYELSTKKYAVFLNDVLIGSEQTGTIIPVGVSFASGAGMSWLDDFSLKFSSASSNPIIKDSTITSNVAYDSYESHGGGIYCLNSCPEISNCLIANNQAGDLSSQIDYLSYGGGIYCEYNWDAEAPAPANVQIHDNVIRENYAGCGGGIYIKNVRNFVDHYMPAYIISNLITQNNAEYVVSNNYHDRALGGGICIDETEAVIQRNVFNDNSADSGGAIYTSTKEIQVPISIEYNIIDNNSANSSGGGVCLLRNFGTIGSAGLIELESKINSNTIMYNTATDGGGIFALDFSTNPAHRTMINDNQITYNTVDNQGGGIFNRDYTPKGYDNNEDILKNSTKIIANTIYKNVALEGGGIYGARGLVFGNIIKENSVTNSEAAISSDAYLYNNIITGNQNNVGSVLQDKVGICTALEIVSNTIDGNIIFPVSTSLPQLHNGAVRTKLGCLIVNNIITNTKNGYGITEENLSNNPAVVRNNLFYKNIFYNFTASTTDNIERIYLNGGADNITTIPALDVQVPESNTNFQADPLFASTAAMNYMPKNIPTLSPAINNGIDFFTNNEQIGVGNGSSTTFTFILTRLPINSGSITITDGAQTLTDDGIGNFTGGGTGTINYETGELSVTFNNAVLNNKIITAEYGTPITSLMKYQIATADGATNSFSANLIYTPLRNGTVRIIAGGQELVDNSAGNLSGDGSGSVNYATGAIAFTFTNTPLPNTPIIIQYDWFITDTDFSLNARTDGLVDIGSLENALGAIPVGTPLLTLPVSTAEWLSASIKGITPALFGSATGLLRIASAATNCYGMWIRGWVSSANDQNVLYKVTTWLSSDQPSGATVPEIRLRINNLDAQIGAMTNIISNGTGVISPTTTLKQYDMYFQPLQGTVRPIGGNYLSFEMLNFNSADSPTAFVDLQQYNITAIPMEKVYRSLSFAAEYTFDASGESWTPSGTIGTFTNPSMFWSPPHLVIKTANNTNTFGFYQSPTIAAAAGDVFMIQALIGTNISDRNIFPTIRLRANTDDFQLASMIVLSSVGFAEAQPVSGTPKVYTLYAQIPPFSTATGISVSLDVLNIDPTDAANVDIYIENVKILKGTQPLFN